MRDSPELIFTQGFHSDQVIQHTHVCVYICERAYLHLCVHVIASQHAFFIQYYTLQMRELRDSTQIK